MILVTTTNHQGRERKIKDRLIMVDVRKNGKNFREMNDTSIIICSTNEAKILDGLT